MTLIIETPSEKKSLIITTILFVALFLFIFLYKFQITSPPFEMNSGGEIAIRFGQNEQGMGLPQEPKLVAMNEVKQSIQSTPEVQQTQVTTQNTKPNNISLPKKEKNENNKTTERQVVKNNQPSQSTSNALNSILAGKKQEGENTTGTGNTTTAGNQGTAHGSLYSNSYYGSGSSGTGIGGGSSWGLNGRSLAGYQTFQPDCNESGTIVVQITVNQSGTVTSAKQILSGTVNGVPCLVEAALKTARSFRWKADNNAPKSQIGFVRINFNVGG